MRLRLFVIFEFFPPQTGVSLPGARHLGWLSVKSGRFSVREHVCRNFFAHFTNRSSYQDFVAAVVDVRHLGHAAGPLEAGGVERLHLRKGKTHGS